MDSVLTRAYKITFDSDPPEGAVDWQLADALMSNFNVPKLGEDLAKQVVFRAVNHVFYPDKTTSTVREWIARARSTPTRRSGTSGWRSPGW